MAAGAVEDLTSCEKGEPDKDTRLSVWNDLLLHVWKWEPSDDIRAWMFLSHGVGEYTGRYENLAKFLSRHGVLVVGHDHVGHGRSGGERVHIDNFSTYVKDVINHIKDLKETYPGVPGFLMGHSMGGLIACFVTLEVQDLFSGVILSSAALELDPQAAGTLLKLAAKVLSLIAPKFGLKAMDPSLISSIPEEVEIYNNDPLVFHAPLKARWAAEMIKAIELGREKIGEIIQPVLLFHGTNDHLVPFSSSEFVMKNIGSEDKTFEVFEDDYHEVLRDKNQDRAFQVIKDWIFAKKDRQQQEDQQQEGQQQEDQQQEGQQQEGQQQEGQQHEGQQHEGQQQEDQQQEDQQQEDQQQEDQQQEGQQQEGQQQEDQQQEDQQQEDQQQAD